MSDLQDRLQIALGSAYRVERELGGGGMSRVFVAAEVGLGRQVVVKVLPPEMGAGVNAERFRREIQLAASLQHPHIVPLMAAGQADDLVWYTMPLVEGQSLREKSSREREPPVAAAVRILRDVADALAYAHAHGVVHRDIKPDNVLVAYEHGMVTDFGIAKAVSAAAPGMALTSAGIAIGTPAYMAPEQAAGDPDVDHRCDIYAVGALGYEMLAGRLPFDGTTPQQVLTAQLTGSPTPLDQRRGDLPPALVDVIMRCLAREPAQRWQSAEELRHAIEAVATPTGTPTVRSPTMRATPRRRRLAITAGLMGAALLLALGAALVWRGRTRSSSATTIAVFPFTVRGGADVAYLGEGIVSLLSTSLDGAGALRSVDPRGLLALVHRERLAASDPAAALRLAEQLRAGLYVLGDVVQAGAMLRVEAAVYDPRRGEAAISNAAVDGAPSELFAIVDRLAAQLLAKLGGQGGSRVTQIAAVTTASLPALKAYLDGETEFRAGHFQPALEAFQRAVAADSEFALAFYRMSIAAEWALRPNLARAAADRAVHFASRLSERDRRLLEALQLGRGSDAERAIQLFGSILAAYPEDVEAWQQLGELRFHYGPLLGHTLAEAREPWERLAAFEPDNVAAMLHLARLEASLGHARAVDSLARRIAAVNPSGERLLEIEALRAVASGEVADRERVLGLLRGASDLVLPQASYSSASFGRDLAAVRAQIAVMVDPSRSARVRGLGHVWLANLELAHGRWRAARAELAEAEALDPAWGLESRALMSLSPFVPAGRTALDSVRAALGRWNAAAVPRSDLQIGYFAVHDGLHVVLRAYLLGVIEARMGSATAAEKQAQEVERADVGDATASVLMRPLARGIRAEVLVREGRAEAALTALDGLGINYEPALFSPFFSHGLDRWRRGVILDSLGRLDEAARWFRSFRDLSLYDRVYDAPAAYRLGRIAEQQGRPADARAEYARFVELWKDCDAELRPMVDSARTALARLGGQQ